MIHVLYKNYNDKIFHWWDSEDLNKIEVYPSEDETELILSEMPEHDIDVYDIIDGKMVMNDIKLQSFMNDNKEYIKPKELIVEEAKNRIDKFAGEARSEFVTTVPAQQFVYSLKVDEAKKYTNNESDKSIELYPLLSAESNALGAKIEDIAKKILNKYNETLVIFAYIEGIRIKAKTQLKDMEAKDIEMHLEETDRLLKEI